MPTTPVSKSRFGGLDGLRALAVTLVLIYHLFPRALPGGFLGVDIFFAISGFLITSLLLREIAAKGKINLRSFWRRRARRLLPAIALLALVNTALASLFNRDLLVGIGKQLLGAIFFISNWLFISQDTDYFTRDNPELLRNLWSLAIEEQFYIVLPLLLALLFAGGKNRVKLLRTRGLALLLCGLGSAWLMVQMTVQGLAASRIYFGSDSHSFGLFLGAALAVFAFRAQPRTLRLPGQVASLSVGTIALAILGYQVATLQEGSAESFSGGFQIATLAALGLLWAITRQGAWLGAACDWAPLRWVGERSYGIYLWHWPLLLLFTTALPRLGWGQEFIPQLLALSATVLAATLSYRYLEQPIRKLGLGRALSIWWHPLKQTKRQRKISIALACVLLITAPLTAFGIGTAPQRTSAAEQVLRGEKLLKAAAEKAAQAAADDLAEHSAPPQTAGDPAADQAADDKPAAFTINGEDITAIGDSVMLASYPELAAQFPGINVDAAVSRSMWAGADLLAQQEAQGTLRRIIVLGLGTNGPVAGESLERVMQIAKDRPVVLINAHGERDWIPGVNAELAAFAAARRQVTVADWDQGVAPHPETLAGDGIHPGSSGGQIYAEKLQQALEQLFTADEARGWEIPAL